MITEEEWNPKKKRDSKHDNKYEKSWSKKNIKRKWIEIDWILGSRVASFTECVEGRSEMFPAGHWPLIHRIIYSVYCTRLFFIYSDINANPFFLSLGQKWFQVAVDGWIRQPGGKIEVAGPDSYLNPAIGSAVNKDKS